jgi:hypothetical protein
MDLGEIGAIVETPGDQERREAIVETQGAAISPEARRILSSIDELSRSLDGASPVDQMTAVFVGVERLIVIYKRIAMLDRQFHVCCEEGTLPRSLLV